MKNLATWLLAAAFTTAALPAFAVEPSVQVGYSPEGSARVLVLSAIDSAKTSIRMMAYSFTAPDIMKALVAAKKRGVDVKIVIDERGNTGLYAGIPEISVSPAPVPPRAHPGR